MKAWLLQDHRQMQQLGDDCPCSVGWIDLDGKREDFPVKTMQYMERKLAGVRKLVMDMAAQIAEADTPNSAIYRVESRHVDQALQQLFRDITCKNELELGT